MSTYRDQQKTEFQKKYSYTQQVTTPVQDQMQRSYTFDSRAQFDKEKDGRPCYPWNWGRDCGFSTTHGALPDLKAHICAYCAYKTKKILEHREKDCVNKMRAAERAQANTSTGKDF